MDQPDLGEQPGERPSIPPLARSTLDRAAHHRRDPDWLEEAWKSALVIVVDTASTGRTLVRDSPSPAPAAGAGASSSDRGASSSDRGAPSSDRAASSSDRAAELVLLEAADAPDAPRFFLGVEADGTPLFTMDAPLPEIEGTRGRTLRDVGHRLSDRDAGIFSAAAALVNWHASHLFSPLTGAPTEVTEAGWSRTTADGKQMWPRTDPAMIVLVHDGVAGPEGRCLLGRNAAWRMPDGSLRFSTLAGFVEPGESVEAAVLREVREEVGINVHSLVYEGSQAWPYPGSLMLGFSAQADRDDEIVVEPEEIAEARWFTRTEVAAMRADGFRDPETGAPVRLPMSASIALYLIERWLRESVKSTM